MYRLHSTFALVQRLPGPPATTGPGKDEKVGAKALDVMLYFWEDKDSRSEASPALG